MCTLGVTDCVRLRALCRIIVSDELAHVGFESQLLLSMQAAVLRRYARSRSEDVGAMQLVTHGLDRLFAAERPGVAALRGAGLRMVDRTPWAKRLLATRAMR